MTERERIAEARIKAFDAMIENASDENVKAYENILKMEEALKAREIKEDQKKVDLDSIKEKAEDKALTEAQAFTRKLREALAIGGTYTALVPTTIATTIQKKKYEHSLLRRYCTVHPSTGNYVITVEGNGVTVGYVAEAGALSDSTPTATSVTLGAFKLAALVKISREMVEDSAVDFVNYVVELMAKGFALKEDAEIISGSGSSAMTGVDTITMVENTNLKTSSSTTSFTWAEFKTFLGLLGPYKRSSIVLMSQATLDAIHEFKDGSNYIFPQNQEITEILGVKVVISPDMADCGAANLVAIAGDFSYYHIADRQDLQFKILNELYAGNDQIGIMATQRIDGKPALDAAFAFLKCKAS